MEPSLSVFKHRLDTPDRNDSGTLSGRTDEIFFWLLVTF